MPVKAIFSRERYAKLVKEMCKANKTYVFFYSFIILLYFCSQKKNIIILCIEQIHVVNCA